jgi:hypothetical protein
MITREALQNIRGFNYTPSTATNDISFWRDYDEALVERELGYAKRLGLNSARVFLAYVVWEREPEAFIRRLRHFVRAAHALGIRTMPVVWDSCFSEVEPSYEADINDWIPNPGVMHLGEDFWPKGEQYCQALVEGLRDEPGLLMWDVMNEPLMTSWVHNAGAEKAARIETIWKFVRHFCDVFGKIDSQHPTTVGVHAAENLEVIGEASDVLSFHDYSATREAIGRTLDLGLEHARRLNKPVFVSEISCLARANPYDVSIQACMERGLGWFTWELMIGKSMWRDIHGIVYPDGTVRDPSIVAAVQGFFRRREGDIVPPNLNKEGAVSRALVQSADWLKPANGGDAYAYKPYSAGFSTLEMMANLIEAGEILPMVDLPSVQVQRLRKETPENREEVCRLLNEWGAVLKGYVETN